MYRTKEGRHVRIVHTSMHQHDVVTNEAEIVYPTGYCVDKRCIFCVVCYTSLLVFFCLFLSHSMYRF